MASDYQAINISFPKEDSELYRWFCDEAIRQRRPLAWLGKDAFECLRLFDGSLERARQAAQALVIVENQYDSVEAAIIEHSGLEVKK